MFVEIRKEYLNKDRLLLPFVICAFGRNQAQNAIKRDEGFVFHHALWIESGKGQVSMGGSTFTLSEGEGFFCAQGVPHSYEGIDGPFNTIWITFLCDDGLMEQLKLEKWFTFKVTPLLKSFVHDFEMLFTGNSTVFNRSAAGYGWLVDWAAELREPLISTAAAVRRFLENRFQDPITLEDVGNHVKMDKYALCRYYKSECGISVMEQLKNIRLAKAKQFLRYSNYTVSEIGRMCGYESPSYFGKLFREQNGRSPKEYQARRGK